MEASLFSIQLLYTSHIEKADSLSDCRPPSFLFRCYIQVIQRRQTLCQDGVLFLFCTASVYKSYREGRLCVRMESSLFSVQLLYTRHTRKTDSVSENNAKKQKNTRTFKKTPQKKPKKHNKVKQKQTKNKKNKEKNNKTN